MKDDERLYQARSGWAAFCGLPSGHPAVDLLAHVSQPRKLPSGALLVAEDDAADDVFLVVSGLLKAVRHSTNGHEIWYADFRQGDVIGEIAVLTDGRRTSSVVAKSESQVLVVEREAFLNVARTHGEFTLAIARMLANRLQVTSRRMLDRVALSVADRLHRELILLGKQSPDDRELIIVEPIPVVAALAQRINATREATSRALSELEERNLVQRQTSHWLVVNPEGLA